MRRTLEGSQVAPEALARAREAAEVARVDVRDLDGLEEIREASRLFDLVWGAAEGEPLLAPGMLRALTHAGNYAAGAFSSTEDMVGAVVGFLGHDDEGTFLHSHILGVSSDHRGANVGYALKQHQRAWALACGMRKVTWTFDPLVRRNAFFNVNKLGADAEEYLESFYGSMSDDVNQGDETDRVLVVWHLDDGRAGIASTDEQYEPDIEKLKTSRATVALTPDGRVERAPWGHTLLCATPADVVDLRRSDPRAARSWRHALRATLGAAMTDGYRVTAFTRSGWYVLERD
jgi:predicted GNAT superfamily acetyltransferase